MRAERAAAIRADVIDGERLIVTQVTRVFHTRLVFHCSRGTERFGNGYERRIDEDARNSMGVRVIGAVFIRSQRAYECKPVIQIQYVGKPQNVADAGIGG